MSVLLYAAETYSLAYFRVTKNVGGFPHEVPTPNPAHTLVSACHKRRSIRSHWLTTCYGLHQKTSLVSIRPHSSAHSGDSSTQRPTLPSRSSIRSFSWWGLDTGNVVLVVLVLAGQTNSPTTLDLFLPTSGDRPFCGPWWSDATA